MIYLVTNIIKPKFKEIIKWSVANQSTVISAFYAFLQARISKKSYNLQVAIYNEGQSKFEINDIKDSFMINKNGSNKIYYLFNIMVFNLSDKSTSIQKAELCITYDNNKAYKNILSNNEKLLFTELKKIELPLNIDSHKSHIGWMIFSIPKEIYDAININTYHIELTDVIRSKL